MECGLLFFLSCIFLFLSPKCSMAADTITRNRPLSHNQTLVSLGQTFELGFFTPGKSSKWYLGIWYRNIPVRTVVWVANKENPLQDPSGTVTIDDNGSLVILNQTKMVIWSSVTHSIVQYPIVQLMDSGNLVLKHEGQDDPDTYIWQSFDYPSDTLLVGMKLGWDLRKGLDRRLTSWKSSEDPSEGEFTYGMDPKGCPELVLRGGSVKLFRSGPWNGLRFSGTPELRNNSVFTPMFVSTKEEVYYMFVVHDKSINSRFVLYPSGLLQRHTWNDRSQEWILMLTAQKDRCDTFGLCGTYGTCNINQALLCECLKGFTPNSPKAWDQIDWSGGCKRRLELDCNAGDAFLKYTSVKLPDTPNCVVNTSMTIQECEAECLKNCSCMAYTISDIRGAGSGCIMWFEDLIDIKQFNADGQDLYVRMAASELAKNADKRKREKTLLVSVSISVVSGLLLLGSTICYLIWKAWMRRRGEEQRQKSNLELPLFDFVTIAIATNNFSSSNKIGEGGFGPVYKGKLSTGQEIAAKRLAQKSSQGLEEFKNEVMLIAKLQHRNLVKLLGYCIQKEEKMLIYEYLPNNSLASFIFDQSRRIVLSWEKRYNIIVGIAEGVLYLHRYSRLRVIHRDLKASNILLDIDMNPKISDFGMARTFGGDQIEAKTRRVVGTYGYMSPEYALDGRFSMKSDVYSFGVLVLETVSGKKNRGFCHPDHDHNLLGHAWKLWNESKGLELVDGLLKGSEPACEALRLIQVGLLCVQQRPEERPNMSSVILMLSGESVILPQPRQPAFYNERCLLEKDSSSSGKKLCSSNEVTVTLLEGR